MEISISKLQKNYDVLYKQNFKLKLLLQERSDKYHSLKMQNKYLIDTMDVKVKNAVEGFKDNILKENDELKLEIEKLKKLLNMDSNNSGIPTSKTSINNSKRIPNSREKSDKKIGGQIGHSKHKLERFKDEKITDTYIHEVTQCSCGCDELKDLGIRVTKDCIDINIRVKKISNEFHNYECLCCGKLTKSPIPLNLKEENQYGNNVKALVVSLVNEGCV